MSFYVVLSRSKSFYVVLCRSMSFYVVLCRSMSLYVYIAPWCSSAADLIRRTVLTGWVLLIPNESSFLRLIVGFFISVSYAVLLVAVRPYLSSWNQHIATGAQGASRRARLSLACVKHAYGSRACVFFLWN
eukprot:6211815-Pleurochrysis_carterae.AAC.1